VDTKAIFVSLAMLGALVMGTGPAAARSGAESHEAAFSSTKRLHPRFPADFPIPAMFVLEHSTGGLRRGAITLRFRFSGDPIEAVAALRDAARTADWSMDEESSYRILFRKGPRTIAAWFGFPSRSLVLDLQEPAGPITLAAQAQKRAEVEAVESPSRGESTPKSIPARTGSIAAGLALALALIGGAVMTGFGMKQKAAQAAGRLIKGQGLLRGPIAAPLARGHFGHHRLCGELPH
jgi:hypothetical protein